MNIQDLRTLELKSSGFCQHTLLVDDEIVLKISEFCLLIRKHELRFKPNKEYDRLLKATNRERTERAIFGLRELIDVYLQMMVLIKEIIERANLTYEIHIDE
jgi:hypothetical protein